MNPQFGLPNNYNRLQQLNLYIQYLPEVGGKFEADNIKEMLYEALPVYVSKINSTANHKWEDGTKTGSEVSPYFDPLIVIGIIMLNTHDKQKLCMNAQLVNIVNLLKIMNFRVTSKRNPFPDMVSG
jgi:hypothetical protein